MPSQYPVYGRFIEGAEGDKSFGVPKPSTILLTEEERAKRPEPQAPSFSGWISAIGDAVALQSPWQRLMETYTLWNDVEDLSYNAFRPDRIAGYEPWAEDFIGVFSEKHQNFIKQRIDRNSQRRQNVARELGLGGVLFSEAFNPVNYIPIPGIMAAGIRGAAISAVGASLVEGAVGLETDPTLTREEARMNTVYTGLFAGALSGIAYGAKLYKAADVDRWINEYGEWSASRHLDNKELGLTPEPYITSNTGFVARPTGAAKTGVAKAYGLEKIQGLSFIGKMQNSGIRAVEDFVNGMLGDYGVVFERNRQNIATESSAYLAADLWRGAAADATSQMRKLYARYLTGGQGAQVFGINLATDMQRAAEAFGKRGRAGSKGLMTYEEFQDEVFRAHKRDRIETDNPFVREGVDIARKFFDEAERAGSESGAIKGAKGRRKFIALKSNRARQILDKIAQLEKKPELSKRELVKLSELTDQYDDLLDDLTRVTKFDLDEDEGLAELLNRLDEEDKGRKATLAETRRSIIAGAKDAKAALKKIADDIEERNKARAERYIETRNKLLKMQEERGLTEAQKRYLVILDEMLEGSWSKKLEPTPKQKALIQKAKEAEGIGVFAQLTERQREYLKFIDDRIAGIYDDVKTSPKNEKFYLTRYWLIDEVIADEEGPRHLRKILFDWFKENPLPNTKHTEEDIAARVDRTINQIIQQAELGELQLLPENRSASASFFKSRELDIPNELVADFIETNMERLFRTYGHRFGTIHELYVKFGDSSAKDSIDDVILTAIDELDFADFDDGIRQAAALRSDLQRVRDTATGAIYSNDPAMLNKRRIASNLRGYGTLTSLGGAGLSSLTEVPRVMMVHGFNRVLGATMDHAFGNRELYKNVSDKIKELTNQGLDVYSSSALSRFVEQGGPTGASSSRVGRAAQKMTDFAHGPFQILNLLAPITDVTKGFSGFMTHQFFLEDLHKIADGKASEKLIKNMASYGLSIEDAKAIVKMPLEKEGDIFLANASEWPDAALAKRYITAVNGMTRRIIPTASPSDLPEIARGFIKGREFPLLTLPFQFMAYGFSAANKVLLSSLQGRDENAYMGMATMIGLGYMVSSLKADLSGSSWYWEQASPLEKMVRAVDQSGIAGIYSEIPTLVETATLGEVGIRPLMGLKPFASHDDYLEALGDLSGPAVSKISDLIRVFSDDDASSTEVGGAIRRSLPFNNWFVIQSLMKDAERSMSNYFADDPDALLNESRRSSGGLEPYRPTVD
ncbi:MAG: hypothetical protein JSV82_00875 [Planctomycetota bacterium]|nr:MAG: hypothetical protein JSV82_00875 [Planctomycetota bacterium]